MVVTTARGHSSGPLLSRGKMDALLIMKEFVQYLYVCACVHSMSWMLLILWFCMVKLHTV